MAGGATAALAGAGGIYAINGRPEDFLAGFIRHAFSSEPIAPGAAQKFAADYLYFNADEVLEVKALMSVQRLVGFDALDAMLSDQAPYFNFKRRVTTLFMLGSTLFQRSSPEKSIEYIGLAQGCANPFARFS
ncbi:hypothetical protein G6N82_02635 [Altererythrobacter sp. BO-6]|uniref:hypothetical protein n=1 Tax=Altererythrobacter sp. BO-6 TaxID=2604537 RepID=UPI0013E103C1|nr:hypothetical protein [Altererythrobacter sp. BO-6]QIG53195.1 hypothetical protein G6N82_02635 [Altererythrobacter sp. BO-6]